MSDFYRGEQIWNRVFNELLEALRVELVNDPSSPALVDFPEGSNADQNQDAMIDLLELIEDELISIDDVLDIISIAIAEINATLDVDLSTRASEATLQNVYDRLVNYDRNRGNATAQTLRFTQASDDDYATGTKQNEISDDIVSVEAAISDFNNDYNNQTDETQSLLQSEFNETQANQLVQTSELQNVNSNLDSIEVKLDTIESTLEELDRDSGNVTSETLRVTQANDVSNHVQGRDVNGTAPTENPVRVAGNDYTNNAVRSFAVDQFAILKIEQYKNNNKIDYNAGAPTLNTQRVVGPITDKTGAFYEFLGSGSTVALPIQIVGNDGLYRAFVDSDGKISVNANVTFPEVFYFKKPLLNGTNKSMDVGATTEFNIAPPAGKVWFIESITISIADAGDFDISDFGAIAGPLTNGLICQVDSKGTTKEMFNLRDNMDLYSVFNDSFVGNTLPGGLFGTDENIYTGTYRLQNRIALDGDLSDKIYFTVRDNLTGLNELYVYISYWELNG